MDGRLFRGTAYAVLIGLSAPGWLLIGFLAMRDLNRPSERP